MCRNLLHEAGKKAQVKPKSQRETWEILVIPSWPIGASWIMPLFYWGPRRMCFVVAISPYFIRVCFARLRISSPTPIGPSNSSFYRFLYEVTFLFFVIHEDVENGHRFVFLKLGLIGSSVVRWAWQACRRLHQFGHPELQNKNVFFTELLITKVSSGRFFAIGGVHAGLFFPYSTPGG